MMTKAPLMDWRRYNTSPSPPPVADNYVAEDGVTLYVAENGVDAYVTET